MINHTSKHIGYLIGLVVLIFLLWDTPVLYPLQLLVVFFHESSHALATLLTGGEVKEMVVVAQVGGHVISLGGNRFVVASSGYLGSLVWGLVIFLTAVGTQWDRWLIAILGLILLIITLFYVRNLFALGFGIVAGVAMIMSGKYLNTETNDIFLRIIGLTSILYVPLDIYSDTIKRSDQLSDARILAENFGGTTVMWGMLWLVISVVMIVYCLHWSLKLSKASSP